MRTDDNYNERTVESNVSSQSSCLVISGLFALIVAASFWVVGKI